MSDIHEPAILLASLLCVCVCLCISADNKNIFAVVVDAFGYGKWRPDVSGSSLVTKVELLCVTFLSLL